MWRGLQSLALFLRARTLIFRVGLRRNERIRVVLLVLQVRLDPVVEAALSQLSNSRFRLILAERADELDLIVEDVLLEADTTRVVPLTLVLAFHVLAVVVLPTADAIRLRVYRRDCHLVEVPRRAQVPERLLVAAGGSALLIREAVRPVLGDGAWVRLPIIARSQRLTDLRWLDGRWLRKLLRLLIRQNGRDQIFFHLHVTKPKDALDLIHL